MTEPDPPGPATSWEARWFFPGVPPEAVVHALFPGPRSWSPPRTDRYLVFSAELGIKLRAETDRPALLEFKGRLTPPESTRFGRAGTGRADRWAKWSLDAAGVPTPLVEAVREGNRVLSVTKTRLLSLLELPDTGEARPVADGRPVARGVQLELSRIRVTRADPHGSPVLDGDADRDWTGSAHGDPDVPEPLEAWSVSFEAFPVSPELEVRVHPVVTAWLEAAAGAGPALEEDRSLAYPAWLLARL